MPSPQCDQNCCRVRKRVGATTVASTSPTRSIELVHPLHGPLPLRFVGVFDLVAEFDGTPTVVEHKTAGRRWSKTRIVSELQLHAYALAAGFVGLGDHVPIKLQVLLKTTRPAVEILPANPALIAFTTNGRLAATTAAMRRSCQPCPYHARV